MMNNYRLEVEPGVPNQLADDIKKEIQNFLDQGMQKNLPFGDIYIPVEKVEDVLSHVRSKLGTTLMGKEVGIHRADWKKEIRIQDDSVDTGNVWARKK